MFVQIVIADKTVDAVHTHTLTIKDVTFGDQGKYTCSVVFTDGDDPKVLITQLSKLCESNRPLFGSPE